MNSRENPIPQLGIGFFSQANHLDQMRQRRLSEFLLLSD